MKNLSVEKRKEIVRIYKNEKISLVELAKKLGNDRRTVTRWIKREGLYVGASGKIKMNSNVFSCIDTQKKAYWLGFLFADGYVSDKNDFELSLGLKDKQHLEKFKKFLEWEGDIKIDNKVGRCRLAFRDKLLVNNLKSLGLVPRKSTILQFPNLKEELVPHFIRGYFDGDGTINDPNKNAIAINIIGTKSFLLDILKYSNSEHNKLILKHSDQSQLIFCFNICGRKARDFMKYIYKDATIYLGRKKERFDQHMCNCIKRPNCKE